MPDLWDDKIYKNKKFIENLNELKLCNIQINQIIWLYNYLVRNEKFDAFKEIEEYIQNKNNSTKINCFNIEYNDDSYDEKSNYDSNDNKDSNSNSNSETENEE